jgi:hypothetical protein
MSAEAWSATSRPNYKKLQKNMFTKTKSLIPHRLVTDHA